MEMKLARKLGQDSTHFKRIVVVRIDSEVCEKEVDQQLDVVLQERRAARKRFVSLERKRIFNEKRFNFEIKTFDYYRCNTLDLCISWITL